MNKDNIGFEGENIACNYLESEGYEILDRNFTCNSGEIDINQLKGIQKVLGYQITSDELYNFFKEFGIDIE